MNTEDELEYLRFFWRNADFGPASGDVIHWINEEYTKSTDKKVPEGYEYE